MQTSLKKESNDMKYQSNRTLPRPSKDKNESSRLRPKSANGASGCH